MSPPKLSKAALLLVDVINDMDFPEGGKLLKHALPAAKRLAVLKARLRKLGVPAIYVNDNFGDWQSDFRQQVERCGGEGSRGCGVTRLLAPGEDDYFILKPRHSGFYCTSLDVLLSELGTQTLILTGFAADICILYTANDAYMRDFSLIVASDCVASETLPKKRVALDHIRHRLKARVCQSRSIC